MKKKALLFVLMVVAIYWIAINPPELGSPGEKPGAQPTEVA
jgi:hypothetical protein